MRRAGTEEKWITWNVMLTLGTCLLVKYFRDFCRTLLSAFASKSSLFLTYSYKFQTSSARSKKKTIKKVNWIAFIISGAYENHFYGFIGLWHSRRCAGLQRYSSLSTSKKKKKWFMTRAHQDKVNSDFILGNSFLINLLHSLSVLLAFTNAPPASCQHFLTQIMGQTSTSWKALCH